MKILALAIALMVPALAQAAPVKPAPAPAPIQVIIVGDFHMSNPGRDMHNVAVDDVLSSKRQAEIAAVNRALARFHPTVIAAEWPAAIVAERYPKFADGTMKPSHNEVVQLGFRLAKTAGARMIGVDADGEFPYDAVDAYAKAHAQTALTDAADGAITRDVAEEQRLIDHGTVGGVLRYLNDPARVKNDSAFYRLALQVGGGTDQPGAALLTAWYHRNFLICANLLQAVKPGDRMVVFYGSGHGLLLRQCIAETPGFKLVEANAYLPK